MSAEQAERIAELERRLGQNSNNSSLPPSSDRFGKPEPGSLRGKIGRKPGKQPWSPGAALRQIADPDEVVEYVPAACTGYGADLAGADDAGVMPRQVRDIPEVTTRVVEPRWRHAILCGLATHPRRDGRKQTKTRNLLERLRDRDEQVLRFARDPAVVPFAADAAPPDFDTLVMLAEGRPWLPATQ